ncbi:ATP-binding protein [Haloglomus halophilum]|uniref:ATP-binding protein n=1 Tax=Haloglomus halophilum TaxID=2962672 RepID=UPI0020C98891|nr:TraM recognition domain-containing protein [Haloglomus halophilum]
MATTGTTQKTHQYLRIRPTNEPLAADRLTAQFTQLHEAVTDPIEFCLVAEPDADEITYYLGAPPDTLPTVRRLAQRLTPDGYAITDPETDPLPDLQGHDYAIAELQGIGERRQDWQTRLRPPQLSDAPEQHDTARVEDAPDLALSSVAEGMLDADGRVVYQALLRPKPDWSGEAEYRVHQLEHDEDTISQRAFKTLLGPTDPEDIDDTTTTPAHRKGDTGSRPGTRIDAILAKSASHSFEVNARLLATGSEAEPTVRELASAFAAVGGDFYRVGHRLHTDDTATELADALTSATFREADSIRDTLRRHLPLGSNHDPCIVADATTVAHFCLLDGNDLSEQARRAFSTLPEERTGVPLPDEHTLDHYDDQGLPLGHPLTADSRTLDRTVSLPPALQPLHVAWFGKTGAGKSTSLVNAILENHAATDGADILIDPKGDGMPTEYLRAHYADHGDLDDVYYFDCAETLPALSFFDIRPQLEAGINRASAVQNVVDHYVEVLRGVMGTERFEQAVRSPDIIRYLVKALFDPVHGSDAYTHADLQAAVQQLRSTRQPPQVSDPELEAMLEGIIANNERSFSELMQGVANRIEKIPLDDRLARLFNHVHGDGPRFDFHDVLDEDAVVLFDLGGLRTESKRVLTLVLLSNLWTALKRRERTGTGDAPLVNLYLEEAASVAATDLLSDLLAQSRSFGLSITLAMQFPAQLQQADAGAYEELLNNVSTIVTGNVPVDEQLTTRFATADMPPEDVGNRLRALERGQWFVSLPAPFGEAEPRPFLVESLPLPPGDPAGSEPLSPAETTGFDALFTAVGERTREQHGLALDSETATSTTATAMGTTADRVDSALPFTDTMPEPVRYDDERHALRCETCDARYEPTIDGMRRAIGCCHTPDEVDRDEIPVCQVPLKLSASERAASDYTDQQLLFLQTVYAASQQRFDPELEFDFLTDSMKRLVEYLGLEEAALQELIDDGLLRHDTDRPHKLYTVTADGRDEIGERHREGIAHGDGEGDLAESSLHAMMVVCGEQYIDQTYADDPDSPVTRAVSYHPVGDGRRLDAAGLDADGEVVVAIEAERLNNNPRKNIPADFDAMAACEPDNAIWIVWNRDAAHEVLSALNDPLDGEPRVEKTYSENSPPRQWKIDTPGFTEVLTLGRVRNQIQKDS